MFRCPAGLRCFLALLLVAVVSSFAMPLPARADGGPVVGPALWEHLKEGQQIAVVNLREDGSVDVDLFVSMLDSSGQSHEITFFVPLGYEVRRTGVFEQFSRDFEDANTRELDIILYNDARQQHRATEYMFAAALLVNGVWLLPVWGPLLFSGCAAEMPEATFETESSQVSIFGVNEDTDLDSLINTTGLDPSVRETLSRLRGQRIAVVTLQTQPSLAGTSDEDSYRPRGEPGLHLSWTTSLVGGETGGTYAYPLGTGESWFHPIELTRVYVVAPPGVGFSAQYPELGAERSGFTPRGAPHISEYSEVAAYAVDEAIGDFGKVWRATYMQSNAAEDIIITAGPPSRWSAISAALRGLDERLLFLYGFIVALAFWLLGWRYLAPRLLGASYQGNPGKLWRLALIYTGFNLILMVPGAFLYVIWSLTGGFFTLLILLALFGGVSIWILAAKYVNYLGSDARKAIVAFAVITVASNGAYFILALAYISLAGFI